jgi:DNA-binding response OmpR family regulator
MRDAFVGVEVPPMSPESSRIDAALRPAPEQARILVVEDDTAFAELLESVLAEHGYEVHWARSVPDARARLARDSFDLVLSDVRLPGGLGVEFLFFEERPGERIPLLMMTAFGNHELRAFVEGLGVELLEKPFDMDTLLDRVPKLMLERQGAPGGAA